ncbi:hypothetical protein Pcinc_027340 [Petrolisthes cinctipes]|uniref:Uncharacterized protein n=1 Tax=Petrolisthes cinctipes TaxID=88211 RepID=A0AAE1F5A5_PETCI|nr:hypothetical protein Pcinc_027340 [Petrolisthes cinctipes]
MKVLLNSSLSFMVIILLALLLLHCQTSWGRVRLDNKKERSDPPCKTRWLEVVMGGGSSSLSLSSPNYPAAYDYHTSCGWFIRPTSRGVVSRLTCPSFELQKVKKDGRCPDYLKVNQVKYCGHNNPRSITITNVTMIKVAFHTNGKKNYGGFQCTVTTTNPNTDKCACSVLSDGGKRKGVKEGQQQQHPWLAYLVPVHGTTSDIFCTASVVSERFLLTSAACASRIKYNKYNYEVLVGPTTSMRLAIRKVFLHPGYIPDVAHSEGNVALIYLKEWVQFGDVLVPVCLPSSHYHFQSGPATFSGWGHKASGRPEVLQIETIPWENCTQGFQKKGCVSVTCLAVWSNPIPSTTTTQHKHRPAQTQGQPHSQPVSFR